jgi:predicted alpha/beta superfamily hydrolase
VRGGVAEVEPVSLVRLENDPGEDIARLEMFTLHSAVLPEPDSRKVLVYLPECYWSEPEREFPVFYMHDGQNLIDPRTSYIPGRTWHVGETTDRLTAEGEIEPIIVVGVENTGLRRMAEYTQTGPENTGLGGSSLGGLISLYLGLEYPEVFGKLAVLSPSIWWNQRSVLGFVKEAQPRPELKIWLDIGTGEGLRHVKDTELLERLLIQSGWRDGVDLKTLIVPGGVHDEDAWAARFDQVLRFLFGVG